VRQTLWILVILGVLAGVFIGLNSPLVIPAFLAKYMSVAILAALDSVLGGLRSSMEDKFDSLVLLAALLAYLGDRLGLELYMAAIVAFGVRIFHNLAVIRRYLLKK
jgi:small basic protein